MGKENGKMNTTAATEAKNDFSFRRQAETKGEQERHPQGTKRGRRTEKRERLK